MSYTPLTARLCDDADLCYIYRGKPTGGRGRPKKHDGKVLFGNLDREHFVTMGDGPDQKLHHGKVRSKALKREIGLVVAMILKKRCTEHA